MFAAPAGESRWREYGTDNDAKQRGRDQAIVIAAKLANSS